MDCYLFLSFGNCSFLKLFLYISRGVEACLVLPAFLTSLGPRQAGQGGRNQGQYSRMQFLHSTSSKDACTFKTSPHPTQRETVRNGEGETLQFHSQWEYIKNMFKTFKFVDWNAIKFIHNYFRDNRLILLMDIYNAFVWQINLLLNIVSCVLIFRSCGLSCP